MTRRGLFGSFAAAVVGCLSLGRKAIAAPPTKVTIAKDFPYDWELDIWKTAEHKARSDFWKLWLANKADLDPLSHERLELLRNGKPIVMETVEPRPEWFYERRP